jgi:hypothetical protein
MREKSYGVNESDAWFRETFVPAPLVGERMYPELDFNSQIRSADRLIEAGEPTAQVARDNADHRDVSHSTRGCLATQIARAHAGRLIVMEGKMRQHRGHV